MVVARRISLAVTLAFALAVGHGTAWAQTKRAMIRTRLYFPETPQSWTTAKAAKPGAKAEKKTTSPKRTVNRAAQPKKAQQPIKEI